MSFPAGKRDNRDNRELGGRMHLIQTFDSCEELEILSFEQNNSQLEKINRCIKEKSEKNNKVGTANKQLEMRKIDIRRAPTSEKMKSFEALVRIDNQIINMTVDTGSLKSFLT